MWLSLYWITNTVYVGRGVVLLVCLTNYKVVREVEEGYHPTDPRSPVVGGCDIPLEKSCH